MASDDLTCEDIFECRLCGQCCRGFGGTYVTRQDIEKICRFIDSDPQTFVDDYCDMSGSRPVLTQAETGSCIFFDPEQQCTIHPVKPYMCRAWPFISAVLAHPENWDAMAGSCPGMKKNIPHGVLVAITKREKEKLDRSGHKP